MKKVVVIVFGFVVIGGILFAQPWIYDFGTDIKSSFTPGYSSTNFLPQPQLGEDFIRVGNSGSINLENPQILVIVLRHQYIIMMGLNYSI